MNLSKSIKIGTVEINTDASIDLREAQRAFASLEAAIQYNEEDNPSGIVGQKEMIRFMLVALLSGAHVLLEGNPGLAKTETCKKVASLLGALQFNRVQFVPDMMPSDLLGSQRIDLDGGQTRQVWADGPIFANLLLADEINRASAKVQAALLEATGEKQVSQAGRGTKALRTAVEVKALEGITRMFRQEIVVTRRWPLVFSTMATMNPIEMEGTYELSEAQLDRFMAKVLVPYPNQEELGKIQKHQKRDEDPPPFEIATVIFLSMLRDMLTGREAKRQFMEQKPELAEQIRWLVWFSHARPLGGGADEGGGWAVEGGDLAASAQARDVRMKLKEWARNSSGNKAEHEFAGHMLEALSSDAYPGVLSGSSPRGMERLTEAVLVTAFLNNNIDNGFASPTQRDLESVLHPILRHRIRLSSSAIAGGRNSDQVIDALQHALRAAFKS
ncbi:AAA family ATPase [Prosthecobacter sp.]|uniref:AAA family ATPase n=1 Tax=Prosthecobacter sp. TaxID=1965333 RepID=UPI003783525D